MTLHQFVVQLHVILSCGVTLTWFAALLARASPWRHRHAVVGRSLAGLVVASSLLAIGLAAASGNRFGVWFALQPLLLSLSGMAQFRRPRWPLWALGVAGLLVAAGVMAGFVGFLAKRELIDVAAFAGAALTMAALAVDDLRAARRPAWQAHVHRMLAVGWFYVAELMIFVFDPHPSLIAWAAAAVVPTAVLAWMRWRPDDFADGGRAPVARVAAHRG